MAVRQICCGSVWGLPSWSVAEGKVGFALLWCGANGRGRGSEGRDLERLKALSVQVSHCWLAGDE